MDKSEGMMKILAKFIFSGLLFIALNSFADTSINGYLNTEDKDFTLLMPINVANDNKINLMIKIPPHFRSLQSLQDVTAGKASLIEFVPEKDGDYNWTQIITVHPLIGKQIKASQITQSVRDNSLKEVKQIEILENQTTSEKGYEKSCLAMDYELNRRHEMVYMCYYSGPYDCTGLQYTVLWPANTMLTKTDMLNKLKDFFKQQSQVIDGTTKEASPVES